MTRGRRRGNTAARFYRYAEVCARLTPEQHMEVAALVLEQRPGWLRRSVLGVPLTGEDLVERRHLLDVLDTLA